MAKKYRAFGKSLTLGGWVKSPENDDHGHSYGALYKRLKGGYTLRRALKEPRKGQHRYEHEGEVFTLKELVDNKDFNESQISYSAALTRISLGYTIEEALNDDRWEGTGGTKDPKVSTKAYKQWHSFNSETKKNAGGEDVSSSKASVVKEWRIASSGKLRGQDPGFVKFEKWYKGNVGGPNQRLTRKNPNAPWGPKNCVWMDPKDIKRRSSKKKFLWEGKERTLVEIAEMEGVNINTLRSQLRRSEESDSRAKLKDALKPKPEKRKAKKVEDFEW